MKKLMFAAIAVLGFTFANAQDGGGEGYANGDVFISGTVGYSNTSISEVDASVSSLVFAPSVGFFVSENIAIGARLGIQNASGEFDDDLGVELDISGFSAGAFGRYYFTPGSKFSVMGQLSFDYVSTTIDAGGAESKTNGIALAVGPGLSYFLNNNFAIEGIWGALSYTSSTPDFDDAPTTSNFTIGANFLDITLGLVYKF